MPYLDVILPFVFKASPINSPNSQYLEIFGFIRIDFTCFSDTGFQEINSVFHKKLSFFSIPIIHKKAITTDTTIYYTGHHWLLDKVWNNFIPTRHDTG